MAKPSIARGTRDFDPQTLLKRNHIISEIKRVFKNFGFEQIETPTIENLSVLMGKYGEEGDQLLFKILNSGEYLKKTNKADYEAGEKQMLPKIAEKGLRYDLTVPFARYVVMHRNDITFPFKRFQIQPVWRADRPQKGRYREFYQCDADVIGTKSLLCEAEIVLMLNEIFSKLGIKGFEIRINNRKILTGISEFIGAEGKETDLCVAIDKLDKIGKEKVLEELANKGFSDNSIELCQPLFNFDFNSPTLFAELRSWLSTSETALKGITELEEIWDKVSSFGLKETNMFFDPTLARGLSYYTGAIFEVKATEVSIGSISGGGRYDDLTKSFGLKDVSGVGISLGIDRIYDVMEELGLFKDVVHSTSQLLIATFDQESQDAALPLLAKLRQSGIKAQLYPDVVKIGKQFDFANKQNIPFVMVIGSNELKAEKYTLKNMMTGEQKTLTLTDIINQYV